MRDNYINLETIRYGKHEYSILKNNDKIMYFELINGKYEMPINSFELYDNEGKSLTSVNQHFFMNQLISRVNIACKKGIFVSNEEIIDYLKKIKSESENDIELKKLFKGTLMSEINEDNFERNKKELLRYLDRFKFDTFVNYNNVAIFNGSLEKSVPDVPVSSASPNQENALEVEPIAQQNDPIDSVSVVRSDLSLESDSSTQVVSAPEVSTPVQAPVQQDVMVQAPVQQNPVQPNISVQAPIQTSSMQSNVSSTGEDSFFQEPSVETSKPRTLSVEELFGNSNLDKTVKIPVMPNKPEIVKNNEPSDPEDVVMDNKSYDAVAINAPFELLNDINRSRENRINIRKAQYSYLDEVRNRIENSNKMSVDVKPQVDSFVDNKLEVESNVINDKSELEEINDLDDSFNDVEEEKLDKKIVVFFIVLTLLLMVATYVIYNYVF